MVNSRKKRYLEGMFKLQEYVKDTIWIERTPLKFYGFECGTRMTVIKLNDGKLFIHSPVKITKDIKNDKECKEQENSSQYNTISEIKAT